MEPCLPIQVTVVFVGRVALQSPQAVSSLLEMEVCIAVGIVRGSQLLSWGYSEGVLRSGFSLLWQAKVGIIMGFGLNLVACLNLAVLCAWGEAF